MKKAHIRLYAILLLAILSTAGLGYADVLNNNEVQFTGAVKTVVVNGQGVGTLFVTLDTFDLRVLVNSRTIIQDLENEIITMDALASLAQTSDPAAALAVEVTGKFSSSGILATRVRVVETARDFSLRGHITRIQSLSQDQAFISLLGITLQVDMSATPPTVIEAEGVPAPLSALQIGTRIEAQGTILPNGTWSAGHIKILSASNRKKGLVFFEGTVQSYNGTAGTLDVAVNGPTANVTRVLITPETSIQGNLAVGAYVLIIGTINPDYSFTARQIRVLAALEIKPDERKLAINESATFTVKLREAAAAEVTVTLAVDPSGILDPLSPATLTIPAGRQTADFTVTARTAGTATITAAALGEQASALVIVGRLPGNEPEPQPEQVRIFFSPDHIKMRPNETREVVLHIHPPQRAEVALEFTSSDVIVVPIPTTRVLSNGAAMFKVVIQSGAATGKASIIAKLPAALGAGMAELVVEVEGKPGK